MRKELGQEVNKVPGRYGEFRVLVDGEVVAEAGALGMLGVLPSADRVIEAIRAKLGR
ncbi:MAG: hypothetical protein LAO51_02515 [Acidobacteriia bacterium]|nr:hypothetical protein [Terriglobia bacterium]